MDIDVEPVNIENDYVTMNDVSVDTGLKMYTSKYNKTSGLKYTMHNGQETDKISAEVLILMPNDDVGSNRKKKKSKNSKCKLLRCLLDTGTSKNTKKYI